MRMWNQHRLATVGGLGVAAALLVGGGIAASGGGWTQPDPDRVRPGMAHGAKEHIMCTPDKVEWKDGPEALPSGASFAMLSGDPKEQGPFTMRVRLPAGFEIAPHFHPADEHVTVISGTFHMGLGDQLDRTKGTALPTGSFAMMPRGERHFAFTEEETIVQIHGVGPWDIRYVNPSDDPRTNRGRRPEGR